MFLKLRTWKQKTNKFIYEVIVNELCKDETSLFTCKQDKNGHDLYIGDIVKHPGYLGLWELVFTPFATVGLKQIRHVINSKEQDCYGQIITLIQDWEQIEYVGDKYQNPELLIGEKKKDDATVKISKTIRKSVCSSKRNR